MICGPFTEENACPSVIIKRTTPPCHATAGCQGIHDNSYDSITGTDNLEPECRAYEDKKNER
jgi:hypothetical protein